MSQNHMDVASVRNANAQSFHAPVLDPVLLASIHQLNLDYLELLVVESDAAQNVVQLHHLPVRLRSTLRALPKRVLNAMAATPYTLYSLGFEDGTFWETMCADSAVETAASVTRRYALACDGSSQYAFCKLALLHAWHVAATNVMAARVMYAMPIASAQRLTSMPLWQIRCIATSHSVLMMPRWPTNPAFWPDLIRFAVNNDKIRLQATRLLGTQLIAAELEVACAMSRRISASVPSPRLRARKLQMQRLLR